MNPLLRFEQVALVRGGRLLFEGLDLVLGPGEGVHVAGANGSGKSSLIRLAAGLLRPQSGRVERSPRALADEHLALERDRPLTAALHFWAADRQKLEASLRQLNLAGLAPIPVRLLSTGQRKRATLARVAASGAPLWLLDEPANGLDEDSLRNLGIMIAEHRSAGGAVLAASHIDLPGVWRRLELGA